MKLFDPDSPLMIGLRYIGRLMALGLCFAVSCLPVVTFGVAFSALYTVCFLDIEHDRASALLLEYWDAFKKNLKKGLLLGLIVLGITALIAYSYFFYYNNGAPAPMIVALYAAVIFFLLMVVYVFPLQARYENPIRVTIRNALVLAVMRLPVSLLLLVLTALPALTIYLNEYLFWLTSLAWLFFLFPAIMRLKTRILLWVFRKLDAQK